MVFQTAPPQPASNARCTCMPELLGGAEANQKGFSERIPAKLMLRSAMCHQPFVNCSRSKFAILHSHNCGGSAARADAISAGVNSWHARFKTIHLDKSVFGLELQVGSK